MAGRTKLTVSYLGAPFSGWQRQPRARTVQGELEGCLRRLTGGQPVAVVGAGRTDAGVHAAAQAAHVDLPVPIPVDVLPRAMNAGLAPDLRVRSAVAVADSFHARKSALGKHYAFRASWSEPELPWLGLRTAVVPRPDNRHELEEACRRLPGRRDWASFTVPEVARRPTVRRLFAIDLEWRRHGVELHFFGEGFLRYQVRRMAGALLELGCGRMTFAELRRLVDEPTPGAHLPTAPAKGLTLERVFYRSSPRLRHSASCDDPGGGGALW
ncbi:MAG: tRNA pseudouridine(38-40) synthase TruA [Thermoanaerobaculales bacterium]|jgi:tRNA pseudouridine38-40 synthase|nr:tRNA pseudouridine(38-40) synthase TruA [Thermoanaerobaculales bacterium]